MKKILLIPLLAITFFLFHDSASATINLGEELITLSPSEVEQKFKELNDKYGVGEPVSKEDEAFIKKYANFNSNKTPIFNQPPQALLLGKWVYDYYKHTTSGNVNIILAGQCTVDLQNPLRNTYRCTGGGHNSSGALVRFSVEHVAWGIIGLDAVGKIYEKRFTNSGAENAYLTGVSGTYSGGVITAWTTLESMGVVGSNNIYVTQTY